MKKRLLALALCLVMMLPMFASCAPVDLDYKGPILQMYLTQEIYDFDPLHAYNNEAQLKVVSMLFATLFKVNADGKIENDLVRECTIKENDTTKEYSMIIVLKDTCWSDGNTLDAEDVITTFERVLLDENSNSAAALLMDIKNAKAIKHGDATISDLGVTSPNRTTIEIMFEHKIDYEQFKYNLASYALAPLPADAIEGNPDWAKKPVTAVYSGPFTVRAISYDGDAKRMILERNSYYYRNRLEDAVDKYVTPYRIVVDFTKTPAEQLDLLKSGQNLYVGEIPLELREQYKSQVTVSDQLSTHTYLLNEKTLVSSAIHEDGFALFAVKEVRQALSLVLDRQALANAIVFAKPATGLVPNGVFYETSSATTFRAKVGNTIESTASFNEAMDLLAAANINPSDYSFRVNVRAGDEVHMAIATAVVEAWNSLGFNVELAPLGIMVNDEKDKTGEVPTDIMDDLYNEALAAGAYEVIAVDLVAPSTTALSVLAPFAYEYSGTASSFINADGKHEWAIFPHFCGYMSEDYNTIITEVFEAETASERATKLKEAEALLLDDMPVIPVLFNQDAYIASADLNGLSNTYFGYRDFSKVTIEEWEAYGLTYGFIEKDDEEETTEAPAETIAE